MAYPTLLHDIYFYFYFWVILVCVCVYIYTHINENREEISLSFLYDQESSLSGNIHTKIMIEMVFLIGISHRLFKIAYRHLRIGLRIIVF